MANLLLSGSWQSYNPAISSLRFFYEKLPSFGVGRVRKMFMYPFSFDEFLVTLNEEVLLQAKQHASAKNPLPEALHRKLTDYVKRFLVLGGMPEVLARYAQSGDMLACQTILDDLIISLKADFTKYKRIVPSSRLSEVFLSVARQSGSKFVYAHASAESNHKQIKEALSIKDPSQNYLLDWNL
ncbi:MAG: ATP-binding protein [Bacteroidales bacterium]|nr:ATP-binding protein [Bacteroidales bacterium]